MNYDEFEAEMLEAGWTLDEIEVMWQEQLQAEAHCERMEQRHQSTLEDCDYYAWLEEERNELLYSRENPDYPIY